MSDLTVVLSQVETMIEPTFQAIAKGYRWRRVKHLDGSIESIQVPLTAEDFLNPQEGDVMPGNSFHNRVMGDVYQMLLAYFRNHPILTVFFDMIVNWGIPGLKNPAPDIVVIPHVHHPEKPRSTFFVKREKTKPILVIEVVSPDYRREDLVDKVDIYEQAGVLEYIILEQREQGGKPVDLLTGYRLINERYRPIFLEDDGRMHLQTIGLYIRFESGKVVFEEVATGRRLQNVVELDELREKQEQEILALRAELARLQEKSNDQ